MAEPLNNARFTCHKKLQAIISKPDQRTRQTDAMHRLTVSPGKTAVRLVMFALPGSPLFSGMKQTTSHSSLQVLCSLWIMNEVVSLDELRRN